MAFLISFMPFKVLNSPCITGQFKKFLRALKFIFPPLFINSFTILTAIIIFLPLFNKLLTVFIADGKVFASIT